MTDNEPTYHYVKGKGWIPLSHDTRTIDILKWRVTVYNEPPQIGDYYARTHGKDLDNVIKMIIEQAWVFEGNSLELDKYNGLDVGGGPFLRIEFERL